MFKISLVLLTVLVLKVAFGKVEEDERRLKNSNILEYFNGTKVAIYKPDEHRSSKPGCRPGYVRKGIQCVPYCRRGCGKKGICVAPNLCYIECAGRFCRYPNCTEYPGCNCLRGYEPTEGSTYCKPQCEPRCGENDLCHSGGKCKCVDNFTRSEKSGKCVPVCKENCLNGNCGDLGICECFPGFVLKDNVCQANCWMDCTNGHCVSENKCVCKPGYLLSMPSLTCQPHCARPCGSDSYCASPNNCKFKPIESSSRSSSSSRCRGRGIHKLGCLIG